MVAGERSVGVTAKYSIDTSDSTQWTHDERYVLYQWSTKPFVGARHRHETVECRVVIEYSYGVGADILLEARSDDTPKLPVEWSVVESVEIREGYARHDRQPEARWLA